MHVLLSLHFSLLYVTAKPDQKWTGDYSKGNLLARYKQAGNTILDDATGMDERQKKDMKKILDEMEAIGTHKASNEVLDGYKMTERMSKLLDEDDVVRTQPTQQHSGSQAVENQNEIPVTSSEEETDD